VLVGQPELITKLRTPSMRQFSQRIAASYHLTGLDREETEKYIAHRLETAGGRPDLFTPAAVDIIYQLAGGIPRAINLVCQAALVYGFAEGAQKIGQDTIRQISKDNLGIGLAPAPEDARTAAANHNGNGFERKIGVLETDLKDLKQVMTSYMEEMGEKTRSVRADQFNQVVQLLKQERQQKEELLRQVTRLEMDNKTLKRIGMLLKQKLLEKPK